MRVTRPVPEPTPLPFIQVGMRSLDPTKWSPTVPVIVLNDGSPPPSWVRSMLSE